jgi:large repetitive protein
VLEPDPETTITKAPKKRTRKAKAKFAFGSSVGGSTFECSLDGKPFVTCSSPDKFKVKRGRHSFAVRAVGPLGNADTTPATAAWKRR